MDGKNHGVVWSKPLPMDRPLWGFVVLPVEYKIQACFTYGERRVYIRHIHGQLYFSYVYYAIILLVNLVFVSPLGRHPWAFMSGIITINNLCK